MPHLEQMAIPPQPGLTEQDFMRGEPAELIYADGDPRIFAVWPHGDETELGPKVGHHIYSERPELLRSVDYMCGNPRAAALTPPQRYTEGGTDLNRSFSPNKEPETYEEHRAKEILEQIEAAGSTHILDLHTSTSDIGRCMLIGERYRDNPQVHEIIAASPISRIIVMPDTIVLPGSDKEVELATTSLIGNTPGSVSIEYNRDLAKETGVKDTMLLIDGLVSGTPLVTPREREFFKVSGFVLKSADPGEDAKNFELCDLGYYPILYGERSYREDPTKPYLGFAAVTREVETF